MSRFHHLRTPALMAVDAVTWLVAVTMAAGFRLESWHLSNTTYLHDASGTIPLYGVLVIAGMAATLHIGLGLFVRLHQGRTAIGSFDEVFLMATIMPVAGLAVGAFNHFGPMTFVPRTVPIVGAAIALILSAWVRGIWRVSRSDRTPSASSTGVLIVGAGEAGRQLVESMQRDPERRWDPRGFVDDDKYKRHFRFHGVNVLNTVKNLAKAARRVDVNTVIIAMPSAGPATTKRTYELARAAGLEVKVLPGVNELLSGINPLAVRDIEPADLLGRQQIDTDVSSIAGYLAGKRVLVTGAGGSIGSELCRQISQFAPAELLLLDRDESALHALMLSLRGRADLESSNVILANIRAADRIMQVFEEHKPQVVFHTAALKHVNMLEGHASEAIRTNVLGSLNVLQAAAAVGVERFVNISTDKAADPENVLGYTKRIAEGLTAAFASKTNGTFLSVRFGNVLGTRGSVLKTFAAQIKKGGPVTVTDPNVTRYFMTIQEAVQLVIQAAAIGRDGEALVLDMGEPVKIDDLARQVIEQSGKQIDIVYTGLKHGEKMCEVLIGAHEVDERPVHPLVSHVQVMPVSAETALDLPRGRDNDANVEAIRDLCEIMAVDWISETAR